MSKGYGVLAYERFPVSEGEWIAKITSKGSTYWVEGGYGSSEDCEPIGSIEDYTRYDIKVLLDRYEGQARYDKEIQRIVDYLLLNR